MMLCNITSPRCYAICQLINSFAPAPHVSKQAQNISETMTSQLTRRAWIRTIIYSGLVTAGGVGYVCPTEINQLSEFTKIKDLV